MDRRNLRALALGGVIVVILLLVAALATRVPTGEVLWVDQPPATRSTLPGDAQDPEEGPPEAQQEVETDDLGASVVNLFWIAVLAIVVLIASVLLMREKARSPEVAEEPFVDPLHRGTLRDVTSQAVDDALHSIRAGAAPDHAIIECWRSLVRAVEAGAVDPDASRTSTELVAAIVERTDAGAADVERLAELYRRARYSGGLTGEDDVQEARAALGAISGALK